MADLSQTAANVKSLSASNKLTGIILGETIEAGEQIYRHTDGKAYLAIASDTLEKAAVIGMCMIGGDADDIGYYGGAGEYDLGGTLSKDVVYVLSAANAGKMCPIADLADTNFVVRIAFPITTGSAIYDPRSYARQQG